MRKLTVTALAALILAWTLAASAAPADQKGCTTANVKGTYGYVGFGTVLSTNPFGTPAGAFSSMGTLTFDGKGQLLIVDTGRVDDLIYTDTSYASTYSVSDGCILTFTITAWAEAGLPGPHYKGVFVDNRRQLRAMSLIPGWITNYVGTTRITEDGGE
jgi:ABC-type oligopeptide transport system substrate-binding subunit